MKNEKKTKSETSDPCLLRSGSEYYLHTFKNEGGRIVCTRCGFVYDRPELRDFISERGVNFSGWAFKLDEYTRTLEDLLVNLTAYKTLEKE